MKRECDTSLADFIPSDCCYQRELVKLEKEMEKKKKEIIDRFSSDTDLSISSLEEGCIALREIVELQNSVRNEFEDRFHLRDEAYWLYRSLSSCSTQHTHAINKHINSLNQELLTYMRFPTPHIHLNWTDGSSCRLHTTKNPYTFRSRPVWAVSSQGRRQHQLSAPHSLTVDPSSGYIYVADTGADRIQVFDSEGRYLKSFYNSSFNHPAYLVIHEQLLYVRCYDRLLKLDKLTGAEIQSCDLVDRLKGLATDTQGHIYSCHSASNIVLRFSPSLEQQSSIHLNPYTRPQQQTRSRKPRDLKLINDSLYILFGDSPYPIQSFTREGRLLKCVVSREQMEAAYHFLSLDMFGNILVTSPYVQKIKVFSSAGDLLTFIGTPGRSQPGELLTPRGVAVGSQGLVVICDEKVNNCLQAF